MLQSGRCEAGVASSLCFHAVGKRQGFRRMMSAFGQAAVESTSKLRHLESILRALDTGGSGWLGSSWMTSPPKAILAKLA